MKKTIVMKKYFLQLAVALLAGAGAMTSCSDDPEEIAPAAPNFPEATTATVLAGGTYTLHLEPNMDWEVKIPDEAAEWFWIVDGSQKTYSVHGKANEKADVTIGVSDVVEFDAEHTCEVKMTMGDQTQTIATLTIGTAERVFHIYLAKASANPEDGLFAYDAETGAYDYETAPAEKFDMVSAKNEYNYMQRILVESNFKWVLRSNPDWMILSATEGEAGKTELFLRTDAEKCPWEDAKDELVFIDATDAQNPVEAGTCEVAMTGCANIALSNFAAAERFNAAGAYYVASQGSYGTPENGTFKTFEMAYGSEAFLVVSGENGELSVGDASSWIHFKEEIEWAEEAKSAGLWSHKVQVLCQPNEGDVRKAYVILIPRAEVPEEFKPEHVINGAKIAADFEKYVVSTISQNAAAGEYIKVETFEGSEEMFSFSQIPAGSWPFEGDWSSAPVAYNLTYKTAFAYQAAPMEFSEPYASVEFYNEEGPYASSQISPLWLELEESEWEAGKEWIKLKGTYDFENETFTWAEGVKPENPMAYIVFKNEAGAILGIVEFIFDGEAGEAGGDGEVALVGNQPAIVLAALTAQDDEFDPNVDCPQYKITYTDKTIFTANLTLPEYENKEITGVETEVYHMGPYDSIMFYFENEGDTAEVLLKKEDGTVVCRFVLVFHEGESGGSGNTGVSLAVPNPSVTLVELKAGDPDYDYGMEWPQYKITSADPEALGSLTLNLPEYDDKETTVSPDTEVAVYAMGGTYMVCFYAGNIGDKADITFIKDEMPVCRLLIEVVAE